jgi:glycerol-3-phosphate dehydrogenase
MEKMKKVIIIGAGVIGCAVARELSKYDLGIHVLEKGLDVPGGTSRANSAIIHAGYDDHPGSVKAGLCVRGNTFFNDLKNELDFHFERNGSLVVALNSREERKLQDLVRQGKRNGVKGLKILSRGETLKLEPNLNPAVKSALYAPTAGIVSPFGYTVALYENAMKNRVKFIFGSSVEKVVVENKKAKGVVSNGNFIDADIVINAAGLYSDEISKTAGIDYFYIYPKKGEYFVFDDAVGKLVSRTVFPVPLGKTKGILITYDVFGKIIIGPNSELIADKEDTSTTEKGLMEVFAGAKRMVPSLRLHDIVTYFAGVRAQPSTEDFIIESYPNKAYGFINLAGIKSPGFTASYAIACEAVELIKDLGFKLRGNKDFNPLRKNIPRFRDLSDKERKALIMKNPQFGHVICRCEQVTEGEIVEAIHRGATTVQGVKFRTSAGFGRCQMGFCGPRIIEILSRETGIPAKKIRKFGKNSYYFSGNIKSILNKAL